MSNVGVTVSTNQKALKLKIIMQARLSHFSNHFQDNLSLNQWDRLPNHWSNHGYDVSSQSQRVRRRKFLTLRRLNQQLILRDSNEQDSYPSGQNIFRIILGPCNFVHTTYAFLTFLPNLEIMNMEQGSS